MDTRYHALCQWVAQQLNEPQVELSVVSGDASFRRYFRYTRGSESWIAMDAPPDKEDSTRFVAIAQSWFAQGIHVPEIKALSMEEGFMLLSDFGSSLLLASLNPSSPNIQQGQHYYTKAMQALIQIQSSAHEALSLPLYDEALLQREMEDRKYKRLFPENLLQRTCLKMLLFSTQLHYRIASNQG